MSNYSINSIGNYQYNNNYSEYISNASKNAQFNSVLAKISNVPTGRLYSTTNTRNTSNYCAIHNNTSLNSASNTNETLSSNIINGRDAQTKKAIEIAKSYVGGKYVWGATGPNAFDCSGFTQYIYKHAYGKTIPRVSYEQAKFGQKVNKEDLQPGDLIFFDTMNKGRVSHVGIYIGNNKFIHAANSRAGIIESELSGYYSKKYLGARRP